MFATLAIGYDGIYFCVQANTFEDAYQQLKKGMLRVIDDLVEEGQLFEDEEDFNADERRERMPDTFFTDEIVVRGAIIELTSREAIVWITSNDIDVDDSNIKKLPKRPSK